jgi:hypothetical protein
MFRDLDISKAGDFTQENGQLSRSSCVDDAC